MLLALFIQILLLSFSIVRKKIETVFSVCVFPNDRGLKLRTCPLSLQWRNWSANTGKMSRWKMGGMSKASTTDPFCSAPLRQRETRLDGSEGVRLLSAHSTPKKRWCKRCSTPMGNLIQTLLPAVIL